MQSRDWELWQPAYRGLEEGCNLRGRMERELAKGEPRDSRIPASLASPHQRDGHH